MRHRFVKNKIFILIPFIYFLLITTACNSLWYTVVGVRKLNTFDQTIIDAFIEKLPKESFLSIIGEAEQFQSVMDFTSDSAIMHSLYQPIQILYFKGDSLVSYHINCTAPSKGLKLNWNYQGRFESFPPLSAIDCSSYPISLTAYRNIYAEIEEHDGYSIIVFWTNLLYKYSRSAIMQVFENVKHNSQGVEPRIYLINNDAFFSQSEINDL